MIPSKAKLVEAFRIGEADALCIRAILTAKSRAEIEKFYPEVNDIDRNGYNTLPLHELKMECVSDIIGGFGMEYISAVETKSRKVVSYVNTGDTYSPTILRTGADKYRIGCWGDCVK